MTADSLISTPIQDIDNQAIDIVDHLPRAHVAMVEKKGHRKTQEDSLFYKMFRKHFFDKLNSIDIARRLWTTVHCLDMETTIGSTASITTYDGHNTFVTATLGDSTAFVTIYGKDGKPLGVCRLHDVLHNAHDSETERARIESSGGLIFSKKENGRVRVEGRLALTRALGDKNFQAEGVIADAAIDIWTTEQICAYLHINPEDVGKVQLIMACDGLTEPAQKNHLPSDNATEKKKQEEHLPSDNATEKKKQEEHILSELKICNPQGLLSECDLAATLAQRAITLGSNDNVSVIVQTIKQGMNPFLAAVFDGHGHSAKVSSFAARWLGVQFARLCGLSDDQYNLEEAFSVFRNRRRYDKDNKRTESKFLNSHQVLTRKKPSAEDVCTEEKLSYLAVESRQRLLNAAEKYLPEYMLPEIPHIQKFFPFLQKEIGLGKLRDFLTPAKIQRIIQYTDCMRRLVLDADIPLVSLLNLNDADFKLLAEREYVVYCLRRANLSLQEILSMLHKPAEHAEKFQHIASYYHLTTCIDTPLLNDILKKASPLMRQELYEYALEIRLIAKKFLKDITVEDKATSFLTQWFRTPTIFRHLRYKKLWLAKAFFEKGYLHYKDLPKLNLSMFQEFSQNEKPLFKLIENAHLSIHEFMTLSPILRHFLIINADKICALAKYFSWEEFIFLPDDVTNMTLDECEDLDILLTGVSLDKQDFLDYSPARRKFLIEQRDEMIALANAHINVNEFFGFDKTLQALLLQHAINFRNLVKNSFSPELMKKRLLEHYSRDEKSFAKLLSKPSKPCYKKLLDGFSQQAVNTVSVEGLRMR